MSIAERLEKIKKLRERTRKRVEGLTEDGPPESPDRRERLGQMAGGAIGGLAILQGIPPLWPELGPPQLEGSSVTEEMAAELKRTLTKDVSPKNLLAMQDGLSVLRILQSLLRVKQRSYDVEAEAAVQNRNAELRRRVQHPRPHDLAFDPQTGTLAVGHPKWVYVNRNPEDPASAWVTLGDHGLKKANPNRVTTSGLNAIAKAHMPGKTDPSAGGDCVLELPINDIKGTWQPISSRKPVLNRIHALYPSGDTIFAGGERRFGGTPILSYRGDDGWRQIGEGLPGQVTGIAGNLDTIYATVVRSDYSWQEGVYRREENGEWELALATGDQVLIPGEQIATHPSDPRRVGYIVNATDGIHNHLAVGVSTDGLQTVDYDYYTEEEQQNGEPFLVTSGFGIDQFGTAAVLTEGDNLYVAVAGEAPGVYRRSLVGEDRFAPLGSGLPEDIFIVDMAVAPDDSFVSVIDDEQRVWVYDSLLESWMKTADLPARPIYRDLPPIADPPPLPPLLRSP